ncbi:ABC transporter substrate-binding protein [Lactiplantibacillus paraplantarum]|uniref:ABC transporter substrate-binding protein n=1 Tax=Lactiplantibacillus paraplantarum TaxID=60520 RepID=UPI00051474E7|nr:ABC transporter substrate-binding protein [Lactiplantibacillus paraplantarum]KGE75865.1 peptide ABC transporter substrate-binding protein [Lactiplantibacillus paraplantarum]MCW1910024.1 ABC transporter substrate-binding protein [Lactiplantibacillus paraplantarum]RDG12609.1 peptide ABC transporter substrate-binding protein [Lactiplantibacillus paraplantarum]
MKKTRRILLGLALIIGLSVGAGCRSTASKSKTTNASQSATTRMVTDMADTKVNVPTKVTRVADLWHANNQVVLLLGGQKKLVATTQMIKQSPWFKTIDPGISKVTAPFAGDDLQTEELLKAKPDVVIAADAAQVKQARKAKIPTVNAMYQTFAGLRQSVNLTAQVLGGTAPKIAKAYQKTLTNNLNDVKTRLKGVTSKPKVLHFVNATNLNQVDGTGTIVNEWIKAAGGQNALTQKGNMISVTTETLAKSNPDVIIVGSATTAEARAALKKNAVLSKLTAVKKNRVYGNPQGTFPWDRYSAEEALQVLWAAKKLHPDQFQDLNMVAKTKAFYQQFYHYQLSTAQANRLLNGASSPK